MTEPKLPPLPEKSYLGDDASYGFDAEDMTAYATQAERMGYLRGLEQASADVRELVEAISDALNEWDHRIVFGGDVEAMAGATETAMVPLRALLAKHNPLQALADNARELGLTYEDGSKT